MLVVPVPAVRVPVVLAEKVAQCKQQCVLCTTTTFARKMCFLFFSQPPVQHFFLRTPAPLPPSRLCSHYFVTSTSPRNVAQANASVDLKNDEGHTALDDAVRGDQEVCASILRAHVPKVNVDTDAAAAADNAKE